MVVMCDILNSIMSKKSNRHLLELKKLIDETEVDNSVLDKANTCIKPVKKSAKNVEIVVFESRKKKIKEEIFKSEEIDSPPVETNKRSGFNFNKARYEIQKFGIDGFIKEKKEKAKVALAIKLGAKPPKNNYVNYKKLMEEKKMKKSQMEDNSDDHHTKLAKKFNRRKGPPKDKNQVRRFDEGFGKVQKRFRPIKKLKTT